MPSLAVGEDIVRLALSWRPAAVFLSFGDPAPFGALVKEAGIRLICQVQDVATASPAGIRPAIPTSPWSGREKGPTSSPPLSRPGTR